MNILLPSNFIKSEQHIVTNQVLTLLLIGCITENDMIVLTEDLFIGRGYERACYRHPMDRNLCIKVSETGRIPRKQQNPVEFKYHKKLAARNIDWSHIARCHGWIETDKGKGLVFDLKHDENGNRTVTDMEI